jgi:hypothetical protein
MDQTHYVDKVLRDLHMRSDKHRRTEIPLNGYDSLRPAGPNDQRIDQRKYQQAIGSHVCCNPHAPRHLLCLRTTEPVPQ